MGNLDLSVVIPAFNAETTLGASIQSALNSGADKVIVVDDGSTDKTLEVARSYGCVVVEQINSGPSAARINGAKLVHTKYMIFLDSDDVLINSGTLHLYNLMEREENLSGAVGNTVVKANGRVKGIMNPKTKTITLEWLLGKGMPPGPPSCAIWRTTAFISATGGQLPSPRTHHAEDYVLFLTLAGFGKIAAEDINVNCYSAGSGRSSKGIWRGLMDVEEAKLFHGAKSNISVKPRTARQLKSVAHWRILYEAPNSKVFSKFYNLLLSIYFDPRSYAYRLAQRAKKKQAEID